MTLIISANGRFLSKYSLRRMFDETTIRLKPMPGRTPVQNTITGSDCEVEATKKPRKQRKDPQQESRRQEKNLVNAATTGAKHYMVKQLLLIWDRFYLDPSQVHYTER